MAREFPSQARVVIIGGGIVGCSVAYHLTKIGWRDVVLLERKQLTCGTTWHAAGLVGQLRATLNLTRLAVYSANLYKRLEPACTPGPVANEFYIRPMLFRAARDRNRDIVGADRDRRGFARHKYFRSGHQSTASRLSTSSSKRSFVTRP